MRPDHRSYRRCLTTRRASSTVHAMTVEPRIDRESPGSATSLRGANQRRVLAACSRPRGAAVTQADLTRTTGLAAGTVSSIVRELAAAAVVDTVRRQRPARHDGAAGPRRGLVAGVDFGHSHVMVAVGDMGGQILAEARRPIDPGHDHDEGLDRAGEMLDGAARGPRRPAHDVRNIGLGPARPDLRRGRDVLGDPARLGGGQRTPRGGRAASGVPSRSTTTPTSARSPSTGTGPAGVTPTWCSSRSPPASAPG